MLFILWVENLKDIGPVRKDSAQTLVHHLMLWGTLASELMHSEPTELQASAECGYKAWLKPHLSQAVE